MCKDYGLKSLQWKQKINRKRIKTRNWSMCVVDLIVGHVKPFINQLTVLLRWSAIYNIRNQ